MQKRIVSHFEVIDRIGAGGMGIVYRARDLKLQREVALKFLPAHSHADAASKERFMLEARAASSLEHPNICTIHEIGETEDGELFIAMPLYEGEPLDEKTKRGPVPVSQAIDLICQVADGLAKAHDRGIVHRDVKPANIFVTDDGRAIILDFGIAKLAGSATVTKEGSTIGTTAYMSPEQVRGVELDGRSDQWSVGVVLHELLAGRRPFDGDYEQAIIYSILNEPRPDLGDVEPGELRAVVDRALSKDRESRFDSLGAFRDALRPLRMGEVMPQPTLHSTLQKPRYWIPATAVFLLIAAGAAFLLWRQSRAVWARTEVLPDIERITEEIPWTGEGEGTWNAFLLAKEIRPYLKNDPLFRRIQDRFARPIRITSRPPGATVYARSYDDSDSEWRSFGRTPLDSVLFPKGFSRIRLEIAGHRPAEDIVWNASFLPDDFPYVVPAEGEIPDGMVLVPAESNQYEATGAPAGVHMPGLEHLPVLEIGDFLMDRYEVTNREYKQFVNAGGYRDSRYWKQPFTREGEELSWDEALALFVDRTGRPGPATWEVGDYPDVEADYPVRGVSWYEAAAYAEFAGKSLPTVYHFDRVAFLWASPEIVPLANIDGATGPLPVGRSRSMNRFGVFDLAGNVREWTLNRTSRLGHRFILGGGWNDPAYAFNDAYAQGPFDRSETNGFRCIRYLDLAEDNRLALQEQVELPFRDFLNEEPASDETFAFFLSQYRYDREPVDASVVERVEEEDWVREKVVFDAPYGGEEMAAYVFLPTSGSPPYQAVLFFPGSGAIHTRSSENISPWSGILKGGRAFVYPVYKSTFERGDDLHSDYPTETTFWKDHVIMWVKDASRTIDYLETREDVDARKIAYLGASWGGAMGAIVPAVETRIQASVLYVAGLLFQRALREADQIHFLPRVRSPVLMLNGKYDFFFPYETSQRPFFELLGTPQADKRMIVYEGGHSVPPTETIKETLAWLDRYLGPVETADAAGNGR